MVPGAADGESIAIQANHVDMVKFASREDTGYETVSVHLYLLAQKAPDAIAAHWRELENIKKGMVAILTRYTCRCLF